MAPATHLPIGRWGWQMTFLLPVKELGRKIDSFATRHGVSGHPPRSQAPPGNGLPARLRLAKVARRPSRRRFGQAEPARQCVPRREPGYEILRPRRRPPPRSSSFLPQIRPFPCQEQFASIPQGFASFRPIHKTTPEKRENSPIALVSRKSSRPRRFASRPLPGVVSLPQPIVNSTADICRNGGLVLS